MDYTEICKYVFEQEKIDWVLHDSKKRNAELVGARQISMYLGNFFYPQMTWAALAAPFGRDHATAMHSVNTTRDFMATEKLMRNKVLKYTGYIREKINEDKVIELRNLLEIKNETTLNTLIAVIDKMELVAKIYCDITNKKIVNQ